MSEQREGGTTTSLEEVFLSREFGRAPCDAADRRHVEIWRTAPQFEERSAPRRAHRSKRSSCPRVSGGPRRSRRADPERLPLELVVPDDAVVTPLHPTRSTGRDTRYRAIAAVSGVAAAALVVAGVASGGGQAGRPTVSAQGERVSAQPQQGGEPPAARRRPRRSRAARHPSPPRWRRAGHRWGALHKLGRSHGSGRVHGFAGRRGTTGDDVAPSPAPTGGSPSSATGVAAVLPRRPATRAGAHDPLAPVVAASAARCRGWAPP